MARGEISWKRRGEDGERVQVYARQVGREWRFFIRPRRFDNWRRFESPPLEDWLELLDGVRRRAGRRLVRPEEIGRLEKTIRERFPEADWEDV